MRPHRVVVPITLAAAGLLDGRRAIFTSAGECAGLDLCLYLAGLDYGSHGPAPSRIARSTWASSRGGPV